MGGVTGLASYLEVDLPAGSYYVILDGYSVGARGNYRLNVSSFPL
ncbi:MAG TPA: hypothetical protein VH877_24890 [Polyangia bacterium]|nr:hypothetical protein [Polyangia bacterium]